MKKDDDFYNDLNNIGKIYFYDIDNKISLNTFKEHMEYIELKSFNQLVNLTFIIAFEINE
jgi:hypothetical protein